MTTKQIQPGDRVAYCVQFLRSIGAVAGDLPAARGIVKEIQPLGDRQLATVDWGSDELPSKVMTCNLCHVGPNSRFCAC